MRCTGTGNVGTNAGKVKPPSSIDLRPGRYSIPCSRLRLIRTTGHSARKPHMLSVLQGQAGATYEDIVGALKVHYGDHQLAAAYRPQLKARVRPRGETLQEFAVSVERALDRGWTSCKLCPERGSPRIRPRSSRPGSEQHLFMGARSR
jgi:hypothetical protein